MPKNLWPGTYNGFAGVRELELILELELELILEPELIPKPELARK
ncbi:hypothetical protein QUF72_17995 [Desulfobacterales bacterium HSG2]|nr:hypothetical protein [Desulfobacterales bacterium HSG2]